MRHFDFTPLYRATVGFDQIADIMDRALTSESSKTTYPPYNIEKKAEDTYRISVAVAGFPADDIMVEVKENALFLAAKNLRLMRQPSICTAASQRDLLNAVSNWPITSKWSQPLTLMVCCTWISNAKYLKRSRRDGLKFHSRRAA